MKKQTGSRAALRRLCVTAVMTALAVIFCRVLGFPTTGIWRVEFSFLPLYLVALLYGPLWCGMSSLAADLIGGLLTTGINPLIALVKFLTGVLLGVCFYKRDRAGLPRILVGMFLISLLFDFLSMAVIMHVYFSHTWEQALLFRGVNAGVNFLLRSAILWVADTHIAHRILRERGKYLD